MKPDKVYILMFYRNGKGEEILTGSPALLAHKKEQFKKERQFKSGLLTIISKQALKYNYGFIKK